MPAQLLALQDGPNILLDKPILLIGRDMECDIQIESRKISRRHCCIAQVNDYLVVRDLGSTNGVRINGVRVVEGKLKGGDELMIGGCRYQVCWEVVGSPQNLRKPAAVRPLTPHTAPIRGDDDSMLEKFDEPVPLLDPHEASVHEGRGKLRTEKHTPPPILPDKLELASSSELNRPLREGPPKA